MDILVDTVDAWLLTAFKWHELKDTNTSYARAYIPGSDNKSMLLHHCIIGKPINKLETDHVNGNGLDCRRSNLRVVTKSINLINRRSWSALGLKGVYKHGNKYRAAIRRDGKLRYLGLYATPEQAHLAFRKAGGEV